MPLTLFVRLPVGELLLSHLGLPPVELLLQLLPWGNPRQEQVEAQCVPVSRSLVQWSLLNKECPVVWVEVILVQDNILDFADVQKSSWQL